MSSASVPAVNGYPCTLPYQIRVVSQTHAGCNDWDMEHICFGKIRNENGEIMTSCDNCANYAYDEDYECYVCDVNLDEDDMQRFLSGTNFECPYFQLDDEYKVVRHQM